MSPFHALLPLPAEDVAFPPQPCPTDSFCQTSKNTAQTTLRAGQVSLWFSQNPCILLYRKKAQLALALENKQP